MKMPNVAKCSKTRFFSVLYSDKTWVFDQSERGQVPICIIKQKNSATLCSVTKQLMIGSEGNRTVSFVFPRPSMFPDSKLEKTVKKLFALR